MNKQTNFKEKDKNENGNNQIELNTTPGSFTRNLNNIVKSKKSISGIQINIRNIGKNIDSLRAFLDQTKYDFDFIGLTECWANEEETKNMDIDINGFENAHSSTKYNKNGGVHIYVNKKHNWKIINTEKK